MFMLYPDMIQCVHHNERDVEIAALIGEVRERLPHIRSFLDVGAHWSHAHYAQPIKDLLEDRHYAAIDILQDEQTAAIVDRYVVGNVNDIEVEDMTADFVACISSIEHCGLTTYKVGDYREEQDRVFKKICELTKKVALLTFPFGQDQLVPGQYANTTIGQLATWQKIAYLEGFDWKCNWWYNNSPATGMPWYLIPPMKAGDVPIDISKGTQCIGILCLTK